MHYWLETFQSKTEQKSLKERLSRLKLFPYPTPSSSLSHGGKLVRGALNKIVSLLVIGLIMLSCTNTFFCLSVVSFISTRPQIVLNSKLIRKTISFHFFFFFQYFFSFFLFSSTFSDLIAFFRFLSLAMLNNFFESIGQTIVCCLLVHTVQSGVINSDGKMVMTAKWSWWRHCS